MWAEFIGVSLLILIKFGKYYDIFISVGLLSIIEYFLAAGIKFICIYVSSELNPGQNIDLNCRNLLDVGQHNLY